MQKFNSTHTSTLPRDAELQQRLADNGGAGEAMKENGAGKNHILAEPADSSLCTKRKMLVGLDVFCLFVGKNYGEPPLHIVSPFYPFYLTESQRSNMTCLSVLH